MRHLILAMMLAAPCPELVAAPARPVLSFEQAFNVQHEPAALHYEVTYAAGPAQHRLELWRSGQTNLRRLTDDVVETYVLRRPGEPDYEMTVLDRNRKIATRIDRTHLYRIGNFTDWFDLAHGLKHPQGTYTLTETPEPRHAVKPIDVCNWYSLNSDGSEKQICWSRKYRIPLLIYLGQQEQPVWRTSSISTKPISASVFFVDDAGFVKNDANQDIEHD